MYRIECFVGEYTYSYPTFVGTANTYEEAELFRNLMIERIEDLQKVRIVMEPNVWERNNGEGIQGVE